MSTNEFLAEEVQVEQPAGSPRPVRFVWRDETHEVAEVLSVRVDTGHGGLPRRAQRWYTRRHRRYYILKDTDGVVFEMYLDYADRKHRRWFLVRRLERFP